MQLQILITLLADKWRLLEEIKAENRNREQMFQESQNQIGNLENSHAELVEAIQGLRRDLNSKKYNCRCNEECTRLSMINDGPIYS